jgi:hypothetical protein
MGNVTETWATGELPILRVALRRADAGSFRHSVGCLTARCGSGASAAAIVYVRRRVHEFTAAATNHPTSAATAIIAKYGTTTPTMCLWFAANHVLASRLTTITALTPATTLDRAVGATRASRKRKASVDEYRANAAIPVALRRAKSSRK